MSNVMGAVDVPDVPLMVGLVLLLAPAAVAVGIMWWLGVFRAQSIQGPSRLGRDESAWLLLGILGAGMVLAVVAARGLLRVIEPPAEMRDLVVTAILFGVAFVIMLGSNALLRARGVERLGIGVSRLLRGLLVGVGSMALMLPLVYLTGLVVAGVIRQMGLEEPAPHPVLQQLGERPDPQIIALLVVSAVVLAPLGEELVFRGLLQTVLVRMFSYLRVSSGDGGPEQEQGEDRHGGGEERPGIQLDPDTPSSVGVSSAVPVDERAAANPMRAMPPPLPAHPAAEGQAGTAGVGSGSEAPVPGDGGPGQVLQLEYSRPPVPPKPTPGVRWAAIVVTSILFALVHGELAFLPPLMILSMALGYTYERTGNLWAPIFMHATFNGFQMLAFLQVVQPG